MTRERCVLVIQTSVGHVKSMTHSVKKVNWSTVNVIVILAIKNTYPIKNKRTIWP